MPSKTPVDVEEIILQTSGVAVAYVVAKLSSGDTKTIPVSPEDGVSFVKHALEIKTCQNPFGWKCARYYNVGHLYIALETLFLDIYIALHGRSWKCKLLRCRMQVRIRLS